MLPGARGFGRNWDLTPIETIAYQLAAQITSCLPTIHPESMHPL